jgi:rhodanese-related sulfurtransferase
MPVNTQPTNTLINPATLRSILEQSPDSLVVDVRTPSEYRSGHIPGSINLPLDQVDAHLTRIVNDAGGKMVLVCQGGGRATQACEKLTGAGLTDVEILEGGMNSWAAAGAPVDVAGDADAWTIERQVRLVAGSLVLGATLASLVFPPAIAVAGFVGAGLTFAALTNSCAMGMLLTRMPWNAAPKADVDEALARIAA